MNRIMYVIFLSIATSSLFSAEKKEFPKASTTLVLNSKYSLPSDCSDDFMAAHGPFLVAASPGDKGSLKLFGLGNNSLSLLDTFSFASSSSGIKGSTQQLRIVKYHGSLTVVVRRPEGVEVYSIGQRELTAKEQTASFFVGLCNKFYSTVTGANNSKSVVDDGGWSEIAGEETLGGETPKASEGSVTPQRSVSEEKLLDEQVREKLDTEGHVNMDPKKKWYWRSVPGGSVFTPRSKDMTLVKTLDQCALWILHDPQASKYSTILSEVQLREKDGSLCCIRESLPQSWDTMLRKYFALDKMAAISANKKIICFAGKNFENIDRVVGCDLNGELKLIVDRNEQIPKLMDNTLFAALVAYISLSHSQADNIKSEADEIKGAIAQLHQNKNKVLEVLQQRYILTERRGAIMQQQYSKGHGIQDGLCMLGNTSQGATCHNNCVIAGKEVHVFPTRFDNQSAVLPTAAWSEKGLADLTDGVNSEDCTSPLLALVVASDDPKEEPADEQTKTEQKKEDQQQQQQQPAVSAAPTTNVNDNLDDASDDKKLATSKVSSSASATAATATTSVDLTQPTTSRVSEDLKPNPNAKCPCGKSNKYYKNCCGKSA